MKLTDMVTLLEDLRAEHGESHAPITVTTANLSHVALGAAPNGTTILFAPHQFDAILTALKAGQAVADTERACRAVEALGVDAPVDSHVAALQECERTINGLLAAYEETPDA